MAIECDKRTNQSFSKNLTLFTKSLGSLKKKLFYFFYHGHIFKNIQNNCINEDSSKLLFYSENKKMIAKWEIVKGLAKYEKTTYAKYLITSWTLKLRSLKILKCLFYI